MALTDRHMQLISSSVVAFCLEPVIRSPSMSCVMHIMQTEAAKRELCDEKDAHSITAARGEREVEAHSLALQEAAAVLNQQRLESVPPLAEAHAPLHNGPERMVFPRRVSSAPNQHPICDPCNALGTTWQVAKVCSISCCSWGATPLCLIHCSALV